MTISLDWIRSFHAVADTGSLSAAARKLSLTQPTIGRHIDLLEDRLGSALFRRGRDGMALTERGADLVATATEMLASATQFERQAAGFDTDLSGVVRIAANEVLGTLSLPHLLTDLTRTHPDIELELVISNTAANLLRRDADIAIRMFRPVQNDLIARKVTEIPLGFFAHSDYLAERTAPQNLADLRNHVVLGFDRETGMIQAAQALGERFDRADFQIRTDTILAQFEGIKAGLGIGIAHVPLAQNWPGVQQVLTEIPLPKLELWLACHHDVRFNRRVRLVMDYLGQKLKIPYPA
jgi:DNA-binding transcriptional LysR family regulator